MTETEPTRDPQPTARPIVHDGSIHGTCPADGKALDPVKCTDPADLPGIVRAVRAAQEQHADKPLEQRVDLVRKVVDALLGKGDAIASMLMAESGKVEAEAWLIEVLPTADLGSYWTDEGARLFAVHEPVLDALAYPRKHAMVERAPRGVVALITPWNFPVAIPLRTIIPALLAGDGVVWKPSEHTPRVSALVAETIASVVGKDLVRLVQGAGDVGSALVGAGVDAVTFTGSVATGRKVAHAAADALVPVGLELGGKDAAIVLDDANLERAANGILWAAMANAGQNCAAIERVYATKGIAKPLRERITALARELVPGRDVGPIATDAQLAIITEQVDAAKKAGATVVAGGERLDKPGRWFAPTVLTDVPDDAAVMCDETFGPVLPIVEVADADAAVRAANASPFGLTASVWTKKISEGEKLGRRLRVGVVTINNHAFTGALPALPWTGVGDSGYGVTNSPHALDLLTRPRALLVDRSGAKREMWWHPYTPAAVAIPRNMAILRRPSAGIGEKVRAFFRLLSAFLSRWK